MGKTSPLGLPEVSSCLDKSPAADSIDLDSDRCGTSSEQDVNGFRRGFRMAAADTACVPARAGTILGVTRSIASPAYRQLERFEPWLRRAVPALLVVFLVTLASSAWIQARDGREETILDAINDIDVIATLAAVKFDQKSALTDRASAAAALHELVRDLPAGALARGRTLLLA